MMGVGGPSPSRSVPAAADVTAAAQLACLLEASAPKPGNVSPGRHFADFRYELVREGEKWRVVASEFICAS